MWEMVGLDLGGVFSNQNDSISTRNPSLEPAHLSSPAVLTQRFAQFSPNSSLNPSMLTNTKLVIFLNAVAA